MNAELYPRSYNVHDSLGEALAKLGEHERALASYRRSIDNSSGKRHVERLRKLVSRRAAR